ncbi:hypothetical protein M8C21_025317 [Ambrosia artemisiifolia]|uniref:Uncharacterized protein n=1 Tax=Ambrosia artemisiifolia TaxID=4212 RepID=A0AAD5CFR6_AMBAR|nr:hypothetical protein M8C21_025317 [Ambrosia artemisiifolia]
MADAAALTATAQMSLGDVETSFWYEQQKKDGAATRKVRRIEFQAYRQEWAGARIFKTNYKGARIFKTNYKGIAERPLMAIAVTSWARAAISGLSNEPSRILDFFFGSPISVTHFPHVYGHRGKPSFLHRGSYFFLVMVVVVVGDKRM